MQFKRQLKQRADDRNGGIENLFSNREYSLQKGQSIENFTSRNLDKNCKGQKPKQ